MATFRVFLPTFLMLKAKFMFHLIQAMCLVTTCSLHFPLVSHGCSITTAIGPNFLWERGLPWPGFRGRGSVWVLLTPAEWSADCVIHSSLVWPCGYRPLKPVARPLLLLLQMEFTVHPNFLLFLSRRNNFIKSLWRVITLDMCVRTVFLVYYHNKLKHL